MDSNLQHHIHDMDLVAHGLAKIISDCKVLRKSALQCVRDLEEDANLFEGLSAVKVEESCPGSSSSNAVSPTDIVSSSGHADLSSALESFADEVQPPYWHLYKL